MKLTVKGIAPINEHVTPLRMKRTENIDTVVSVPVISGVLNSLMVRNAACRLSMVGSSFILRFIPSTITMAESTRIPIARMRANRLTKFIVLPVILRPMKPITNDRGMALPATKPSRQPIAMIKTKITKTTVVAPDVLKRVSSFFISAPLSRTVRAVITCRSPPFS